jgi:hypothetical protein
MHVWVCVCVLKTQQEKKDIWGLANPEGGTELRRKGSGVKEGKWERRKREGKRKKKREFPRNRLWGVSVGSGRVRLGLLYLASLAWCRDYLRYLTMGIRPRSHHTTDC